MKYKLLFLSKREIPDLQEAVALPTTRVKAPEKDNNKKLFRLMKHLRENKKFGPDTGSGKYTCSKVLGEYRLSCAPIYEE